MNSMHPVVTLGSYFWNEALLPKDEFEQRLSSVRTLMQEQKWDGLCLYGDCKEAGALSWLGNLYPRWYWCVLLVSQSGDPLILAPGGTRDLPITAAMTWIKDVRPANNLSSEMHDWASAHGLPESPSIAVYGANQMSPNTYDSIFKALASVGSVVVADSKIEELWKSKRPRDARMMRASCDLLHATVSTFRQASLDGQAVAESALKAERYARMHGAYDVRILLSRSNGHDLEPFVDMNIPRDGSSIAWFGLSYLGYWAEGVASVGSVPEQLQAALKAGLEDLIEQIAPRKPLHALRECIARHQGAFSLHEALTVAPLRRIGLSLNEDGLGEMNDAGLIQADAFYSLTLGLSNSEVAAAASAIVRTTSPTEVLWKSLP
jgi:hypothetical protein